MRNFGIRAPIAVIPIGVDLSFPSPALPTSSGSTGRTLLFLGRISPIKHLPALVRAWLLVQDRFPDARLRIIGPDDRGHSAEISSLAHQMGAKRVSIEPGVWGEARDTAFRSSHAVILPSLSESFGLVVAECLAMGRPAIATIGTPWEILRKTGCGWWVDSTPEAMAQAIAELFELPIETLASMGARARILAVRNLGWSRALPRFLRLYEWMLGGGNPPEFVSR